MPHPPLTVIMPMFNAAPFVRAAVDSVLAQTFTDFDFLIVDDGSTDGSADIIRDLAAEDARIQLIVQDNQGIVPSLHRMIARAQGRYIARMDADDLCLPERFARQIACLEARPELGAVGTQFIEIDARGAVRDAHFRHPVGSEAVHAQLLMGQPLANPTVMFRADALRAAGGYRAAFRYCEDYDLFLRLSRLARLDNLPDVLFHYRRSAGQMSVAANARQTRQSVKARFAHHEVLAGRPDPFDGLATLPTVDQLDALVGRAGVGAAVGREIALRLLHNRRALRGEEFAIITAAAASPARLPGGWRAVLRCLRFGMPLRAARLALALVAGAAVAALEAGSA